MVLARASLFTCLAWASLARAEEVPETRVEATSPSVSLPEGRAGSTVRRADLERRLPRSAPDALRWEPGVFVQQTAHAQGSAFLRGLTGQQTLLLFDGIRLNTSTWRQGPNQYFFTLDSRALDSIEVLRGGASTQYGSDALGGALLARPIEPPSSPAPFKASFALRGATADEERGGRVQVSGASERLAYVAGFGGRRVGLLESGGPVLSPVTGRPAEVPRFAEEDGRTQLGTGFDELTADGRLVVRLPDEQTLTTALYLYRQYDAPRTDQCPAAFALYDECLNYDEQFRTLAYATWERRGESSVRATLSWQRQHEQRTLARPSSFAVNRGADDVDTLGATVRVLPRRLSVAGRPVQLTLGADAALDLVQSRASIGFTDIPYEQRLSRGQYLDGSRYFSGGFFADAEALLRERLTARVGSRLGWALARAPGDPESGTAAVRRGWVPLVGHAGVEWRTSERVALFLNLDHSFRAPNLDDLTSRQQTGPGFQFENAALEPERATTAELGSRLRTARVNLEGWAFATRLGSAISRQPREVADCPPETPQCNASRSLLQLVNAPRPSALFGLEGALRLRLPASFTAGTNVSWTFGEGPNLSSPPSDPSLPFPTRVPLSRVPPLHGSAELLWTHPSGVSASAGLRWATLQRRLAIADTSDARIPQGGTPGFAVGDLRVGYRWSERVVVAAVLENVTDAAYRAHGSSVNGPGRGLVLSLELAPF